eukprot:325025-Pelagomonas_calceolata.AAC.1
MQHTKEFKKKEKLLRVCTRGRGCFEFLRSLSLLCPLEEPSHLGQQERKGKKGKIYACRLAACVKERASQWFPLTEGIFISTPTTRIRSGDLLLDVALLALDQGSVTRRGT